jgi:hypothetical protein
LTMFWLPQFRQLYTMVFAIICHDYHTSLILNHDRKINRLTPPTHGTGSISDIRSGKSKRK